MSDMIEGSRSWSSIVRMMLRRRTEIAIVFAKDKRKTPGEMRGGRDVGPRGALPPNIYRMIFLPQFVLCTE
jgi:hypothetical protein